MLQDLPRQRLRLTAGGVGAGGAFPSFDDAQNDRVVCDAEACHRGMFYGNVPTWDLWDTPTMQTLQALLDFFGGGASSGAKAVV